MITVLQFLHFFGGQIILSFWDGLRRGTKPCLCYGKPVKKLREREVTGGGTGCGPHAFTIGRREEAGGSGHKEVESRLGDRDVALVVDLLDKKKGWLWEHAQKESQRRGIKRKKLVGSVSKMGMGRASPRNENFSKVRR